ncbi:MAG TPA: hypothetical protein VIB62_06600 [Actinomycetota bacterium]|jgi:hypothetical protein
MSVRTETFGHQAPRIPLVSIVAGILAFAIGIALGATVLDRDGDTTVSAPGAVVEAPRGWDAGMLEAAELRSQGYGAWDPGMLEAAAQRAQGMRPVVYVPREFLEHAESTAGLTEPVLRGPGAGLPKRGGEPTVQGDGRGGLTPEQYQTIRNQVHAS